jgi:hypothetical protein
MISKSQRNRLLDQRLYDISNREKIMSLARELYGSWEITREQLMNTYVAQHRNTTNYPICVR